MFRRAFAVLLVLLPLCGCRPGATDVDSTLGGHYELRTVDGSMLPYEVTALKDNRVEILAGHVQAEHNKSFSSSLTVRTTVGGIPTTTVKTGYGLWAQSGNRVRFTYVDSGADGGFLDGDDLVLILDELRFVFVRA